MTKGSCRKCDMELATEKITLRIFALALIARFALKNTDKKDNNPEETFLLDQYKKCPLNGGDWNRALSDYMLEPKDEDRTLIALARHLKFSNVEVLAIALALSVEENMMVGRCMAWVQAPVGGSRPTLGLLENAFASVSDSGEGRSELTAEIVSGQALQCGMLTILNEAAPMPEQTIKVTVAISLALRGRRFNWPGAREGLIGQGIVLPPSVHEDAKNQAKSLIRSANRVLVLRTTSSAEGQTVSQSIAGSMNKQPVFIRPEKTELKGLGALCIIRNLVPVYCHDLGPGEHYPLPQLYGYNGPVLVVSGPEGTFEYPDGTVMTWEIPNPTYKERAALWRHYLPEGEDELADALAKEHLHRPGRIAELARLAIRQTDINKHPAPTREDVRQAAWLSEGGGLGALAQPIKVNIPDKALIVTKQLKKELDLLLARCRQRELLAKDLGITLAANYQVGVRALVVGESGTGKTLAISWLATQLMLPLYRVDLASVTSKYIGETEKNLSRLLSRAEQDEVVLLFDEADSMFGKRTDIKDANDRFANAQTNYLLQRIESYTGIVFLTSNSRARFDSSFTRRIDMIVEFTTPGPEERRRLWYVHLGDGHKLTCREINQLSATADLCGGHIRNVVLTAAVLAQSDNRLINFADIRQGLMSEYKKLGKKLPMDLADG